MHDWMADRFRLETRFMLWADTVPRIFGGSTCVKKHLFYDFCPSVDFIYDKNHYVYHILQQSTGLQYNALILS
jgi:hypothetical protein